MLMQLGKYTVERELRRRESGTVFLAHDPVLQRRVILTVLEVPPEVLVGDRDWALQQLAAEARAATAISSPRLAQVYGAEVISGQCVIASEFCEGVTLRTALESAGAFEPARAIWITIQTLEALHAIHSPGLTHGEVHPGNIVLTGDSVKLTGLGVLDITGTYPLTDFTSEPGNTAYVAPEQVLGQDADARTDLFTAGVILYEMLTGRRAFDGATTASTAHAIVNLDPRVAPCPNKTMQAFIVKAISKDPEQRFQSAVEMATALRTVANDLCNASAPLPGGMPRGAAGSTPAPTTHTKGEKPPSWFDKLALGIIAFLALNYLYDTVIRTPGIVPGARIGRAAVGDTFAAVRETYGQPEGLTPVYDNDGRYQGEIAAHWRRYGISVLFEDTSWNSVLDPQETAREVMAAVPFRGQTRKRLGIGSTRKAVHNVYGATTPWWPDSISDLYQERGINFGYNERGWVDYIAVYRPRARAR